MAFFVSKGRVMLKDFEIKKAFSVVVTHSAIASCATFLFLPHFDVICDLLLNRRTATWNLFVNYTRFHVNKTIVTIRHLTWQGSTTEIRNEEREIITINNCFTSFLHSRFFFFGMSRNARVKFKLEEIKSLRGRRWKEEGKKGTWACARGEGEKRRSRRGRRREKEAPAGKLLFFFFFCFFFFFIPLPSLRDI